MKCSICGAENPPDAKSCHQCGFSFDLGQSTWPDFPTIEVPKPIDVPTWPEFPEAEVPSVPSEPVWRGGDAPVRIESAKAEPVAEAVEDDDQLARSHIARGFEAIREGLYDQAKWEFQQACDLADDPEIVRLAQAQLSELSSPAVEVAQQPAPPSQVQPRPMRPREPAPRPTTVQIGNVDWNSVVGVGLAMGVLNGVLTGCTAPFCAGFLLSPVFGFVAGWLAMRNKTRATHAVHRTDQTSDVIQAIAAGGIAGLGGWLGQVIGYPIWWGSLSVTQDSSLTLPFIACVTGGFYIPMSAALGALGWRLGRRNA
jgi:hypothetical protein